MPRESGHTNRTVVSGVRGVSGLSISMVHVSAVLFALRGLAAVWVHSPLSGFTSGCTLSHTLAVLPDILVSRLHLLPENDCNVQTYRASMGTVLLQSGRFLLSSKYLVCVLVP